MTVAADPKGAAPEPAGSPARDARILVRRALKSALGTLARTSQDPYVSLVTVATAMDGAPLVLISKLALHTQNIAANPRASLLVDGTDRAGDPLAGGRVTLMGELRITTNPQDRRRFLARHPEARMYADFPDFAFYKLEIERAHFIGGFGRIVDLEARDTLLDLRDAMPLTDAEPDIIQHMNDDHADAVQLYAVRLANGASVNWVMTGLDPEGFDLVGAGETARINFAHNVFSADAARGEFVRMAAEARSRRDAGRAPPA